LTAKEDALQRPDLVVSADWSKSDSKRWMARAELQPDNNSYRVFPPEPVGQIDTLFDRLIAQSSLRATILLGLDFPIGLPRAYATTAGLRADGFRKALGLFGRDGRWKRFYEITDSPEVSRPFYPPPTQLKGLYSRASLLSGLGLNAPSDLLRLCDRKTGNRPAAESLFFTLGGKQVGPAVIEGWSQLLAPALPRIRIWPFDGDLHTLLNEPGTVIAEIYPGEAYHHLGLVNGVGQGRSKRRREDRRSVGYALLNQSCDEVQLTSSAISWIEWGFLDEDDFDATVGLLSMLQVVTGHRSASVPHDPDVRMIEGWILGQEPV
jgi:hypothetical protein